MANSRFYITGFLFLCLVSFPLYSSTGDICLFNNSPDSISYYCDKGLKAITENNGKAIVHFLSHDLLEGRKTGERGNSIAAQYIASVLMSLDLHPVSGKEGAPDVYMDRFKIKSRSGDSVCMANVLGFLKGRSNEWVVVGAHFDHLGKGDGNIYNGADDNASGVSAVLQIAKAFAESGYVPERNILFALWDGEERGLLGSLHFVEHIIRDMKISAYINFDMIGRNTPGSGDGHVEIFYMEKYPTFEIINTRAIKDYGLRLSPIYKPSGRLTYISDNSAFARKGIPYVWYHTGDHQDYHKMSDHAEKINWEKLTEITKAGFLTSWKLANNKGTLKKKEPENVSGFADSN